MAQVKRIRRSISGILVLDKPRGMSSNQALQKVRWLLNAEKAGHTGSLDPLATGVLPLCFGEATKFSQYLLDADKGYETVMRMGITTTITLETLERVHAEGGPEALDQFLMPEDSGLLHWPVLQLSEHSAYYWLHGQPVRAPEAPKFGWLRVQDQTGRFIGIGEVTDDGRIAPRRLIRS